MRFFSKYFKLDDIEPMDNGEYSVCCPFPHKDQHGNDYKETHASAHINPEKEVFHCKVCDIGMSEASFVQRIEGISYKEALKTIQLMEREVVGGDWAVRVDTLKKSSEMLTLHKLGIDNMVDTLQLGYSGDGIDFPVFMYGELMDVRTYRPDGKPKVKGRAHSTNLIIPFDLWRTDERDTILAAGEKDMAILRALHFNAISFTGGEQSFPKLFKHSFKGRRVFIMYDNDDAGRQGAKKAAHFIKEAGGFPHIVTGHYDVCTEKGEDVWDYIKKYGKTSADIVQLMATTPEASLDELEEIKNTIIPMMPIGQAGEGQFVNKRFVRSNASVLSIFSETFSVPEFVVFEKTRVDEGEDTIFSRGDTVEWSLDDENMQDLLYLIDGKVTEAKRDKELRRLAGISAEKNMSMKILSTISVSKCVISDILETSTDEVKVQELLVYVVNKTLSAGTKYIVHYKPVAHPLEGLKVVGIVKDFEESDADLGNFKVTDEVKKSLQVFQVPAGQSVNDKMQELFQRSKGFIGVEARKEVMFATDMFYHTPLQFKIGTRVERAYLDVMIVGDPRTMKSATAKAMKDMYELGTVTSLKTATEGGLIGGSEKMGGAYKTRIGLIPQCHKGAIVMEEFSGGLKNDLVSKLTEIRSSNRVRILRVNGQTDVPALVRMLSISNPAPKGKVSMALNQYPSGIQVILDLVGASEDIARYDFFLLVNEVGEYTNPLDMFELEPYAKKDYMNRVRWVWSRTPEQVNITQDVAQYVWQKSQELNQKYDCHIKLFGAEAWKKLLRIATATAGMVCSTDETYENIVVTQDHVDFAAKFMIALYDNDLFKLRNYVENERAYGECTENDVAALQGIYTAHASALNELELATDMTQKQLQLISGLENKDFASFTSRLGSSRFIQWQGEKIVPTMKFRKGMKKINRNVFMRRPSESGGF